MHDKIYITCKLGDDPIGMIVCDNDGGRSCTFAYFVNLTCFECMKKTWDNAIKNYTLHYNLSARCI